MCAGEPILPPRINCVETLTANDNMAAVDALLDEVTGGNFSIVESPVVLAAA
jgi:hypothetical protein